jgi:hypothetical protein
MNHLAKMMPASKKALVKLRRQQINPQIRDQVWCQCMRCPKNLKQVEMVRRRTLMCHRLAAVALSEPRQLLLHLRSGPALYLTVLSG